MWEQWQESKYRYACFPIRVIDGDTVEVRIDLGFSVAITEKIRLYGIDAPEMRGDEKEDGRRSKDHLINMLGLVSGATSREFQIITKKDKRGKYGRMLGIIWMMSGGNFINVNDEMVQRGFAEPWFT